MTDQDSFKPSGATDTSNEDEGQSRIPYEKTVGMVVKKISNEPFLFVIAITALLIGLVFVATKLGSLELRLVVAIVAVLAITAIIGYYYMQARPAASDRNDEQPEAVPAPEETVNPILECQDQMERAGLPTQETLARLQQIHLYHPELFADSNGFTTVVDLAFPFSGVVTLDEKQLRLRSIYRYPKDENERAWESLYKEHLDLLNERWRRDEKWRLRSGTFARYLGRLERHSAHTTSYIESYWQETDDRALARASQLQEEVKGIAQPDASERSRLIETERLLNSLHTLIKSVQPLAMG